MNSLYGRFGMDPNFENNLIIEELDLDSYMDKFVVLEYTGLCNNKLLICYKNTEGNIPNSMSKERTKNVSVPIASAITAYARIFMSQFKNNPEFLLYYSDTDSIYVDRELDPKWLSNKLGHFKLENIFTKAVFLAPKVYGGITESGEEITKVKGLKNKVSFEDLESLLAEKKSIEFSQEKWFKSIKKSNISVVQQIYTLTVTDNKRQLVYKNKKLGGQLLKVG